MSAIQEKNKKKWTKDGRSWYYTCYYTNIYGKKRRKRSKLFKTKKEAKDEEIKFLNKMKIHDVINSDPNFIDVYNEWFEYKKSTLKSSSYYDLKLRLDKHILDHFKEYKLYSIKINDLNAWKNILHEKEFTLPYQNRIIGSFKEILDYSVINYDFDIKIANKLYKYRIETSQKKTSAEDNFWTFEEFTKFINFVDDEFYELIFNFLYYTGLRISEMMALTWKDIDLENKKLYINKTLTHNCFDATYLITDPKTKNSIRIIDLDDNIIKILKMHYKKESRIYNFNKDMFLFGNVKYVAYTTFERKLNKYIEISEVKKITPHGFRHSHASLLWDLGCTIEEIAKRLGDTPSVVENTYAHIFPKKVEHTITVLNKFMKNST